MMKAMGESLRAEGGAASPGPATPLTAEEAAAAAEVRRANLRAAVEGDDWSAVIDAQTQETVAARGQPPSAGQTSAAAAPAAPPPSAPQPPMATPFAQPLVHRSVGAEGGGQRTGQTSEMTVEAVDRALDEVRPYLIADGGNVEVVGVEGGVVYLQLQVGAGRVGGWGWGWGAMCGCGACLGCHRWKGAWRTCSFRWVLLGWRLGYVTEGGARSTQHPDRGTCAASQATMPSTPSLPRRAPAAPALPATQP